MPKKSPTSSHNFFAMPNYQKLPQTTSSKPTNPAMFFPASPFPGLSRISQGIQLQEVDVDAGVGDSGPRDASLPAGVPDVENGLSSGSSLLATSPSIPILPNQAFACYRPLSFFPAAHHAFFRIGSTVSGHTTYSLEPINTLGDCYQGVAGKNYHEDFTTNGVCTTMPGKTESDIIPEHRAYPIGKYCTLGPNSNTYTATVLRRLGLSASIFPGGWRPGEASGTPPRGSFAPSPGLTLTTGCRDCDPIPNSIGDFPDNVDQEQIG